MPTGRGTRINACFPSIGATGPSSAVPPAPRPQTRHARSAKIAGTAAVRGRLCAYRTTEEQRS